MIKKLDIIWNITLVCPWDCEFCCTDAVHVSKKFGEIIATEHSLTSERVVDTRLSELFKEKYPTVEPTQFDLALLDRQLREVEPNLENKLQILKNLEGYDVSIDFAGGDPLSCYENYLVIKEASKLFGADNISITSTGYSIKRYELSELAEYIGEYEFTYDESHTTTPCTRPNGYNGSNIKIAERFAQIGIRTKAQLPLHVGNIESININKIYAELDSRGIDELLLMRTFPVGRGIKYSQKHNLDREALRHAINKFTELSEQGRTKVRLQCALKHLTNSNLVLNPCDMMRESFGINYKGELLLSAWANNSVGLPLGDEFVIGSLVTDSFLELSISPNFQELERKMNENFGHCKIFSYMYGGKTRDSLFKTTDPLYI